MHHDAQKYPDPYSFRVSCWLGIREIALTWYFSPSDIVRTMFLLRNLWTRKIQGNVIIGHSALGMWMFITLRFWLHKSHRRRICPGIHLAEKEIFLAVVQILWAFHVEALYGEQNVQETRESDYSILRREIRIVPRIENLGDVLDIDTWLINIIPTFWGARQEI